MYNLYRASLFGASTSHWTSLFALGLSHGKLFYNHNKTKMIRIISPTKLTGLINSHKLPSECEIHSFVPSPVPFVSFHKSQTDKNFHQ